MTDYGKVQVRELPIFRLDRAERSLFYTPGYVVVVDAAQAEAFQSGMIFTHAGAELCRYAIAMENNWLAMLNNPFEPVCLTLYLNNICNLDCGYCYSANGRSDHANPKLDPEVIRAAAEVVAVNCVAQGCPFTVVFHGGGEPALDQRRIETALDVVEEIAREYGLKLFRYIATNGVMSESKAHWLAGRFDQIGLSCDGPADIQVRQRPLLTGQSSTPYVERTARVVREHGKVLTVRVTVTPQSYMRQTEIADYICRELMPREIYVEPVYLGGRTGEENVFSVEQADGYVNEFCEARQAAHQYGIPWLTSGSRPAEIHGPYCNHIRNVLNLTPDGQATNCFKIADPDGLREHGVNIGRLDKATGRFIFDDVRIQALRQYLGNDPPRCKACLNRFHCVSGCPDQCLLEDPVNGHVAEFRCRIQRLMMERYLWEQVEDVSLENSAGIVGKKLPFMTNHILKEEFQ